MRNNAQKTSQHGALKEDTSRKNPKYLIQLQNITKIYRQKGDQDNVVLKDVNFNIRDKEVIGILGPNGTGKTTLVEMICQTKSPTSGKIYYNFAKGGLKDNIGVQFQEGAWPPGLTARDIIEFYLGIYTKVTVERIRELIEVFEIEDFYSNRPLSRLSGGQKQRFNALLAVLHNPKLIVFDEITTGLDIELQYKILSYVRKIARENEHTILIVSHGPEEIESLADRIIIIAEGGIYVDYSLKELLAKYKTVRNMLDLFFAGKLESNMVNHGTEKTD